MPFLAGVVTPPSAQLLRLKLDAKRTVRVILRRQTCFLASTRANNANDKHPRGGTITSLQSTNIETLSFVYLVLSFFASSFVLSWRS
jgi:hypothetical protein